MGRQYSIAHYEERLGRIREAIPGIAVSTDVIVGFCGETEAQFASTLRLLGAIRYEQVFAAAYSPRSGAPATRLPDDVPAAVKKERLNRLLAPRLRARPSLRCAQTANPVTECRESGSALTQLVCAD